MFPIFTLPENPSLAILQFETNSQYILPMCLFPYRGTRLTFPLPCIPLSLQSKAFHSVQCYLLGGRGIVAADCPVCFVLSFENLNHENVRRNLELIW